MSFVKYFIHNTDHQHQLKYYGGNDDENPKSCKLCGLLVFTNLKNPFYACSITSCSFFLHQHCANLSDTFSDRESFVDEYDPFILLPNPRSEGTSCLKCGEICKNYTYCPSDKEYENIGLHPLCAFPNEMQTQHRSHSHPLTQTQREIVTICRACGEQEEGVFFSCQLCNYWIHQNCASLPTVAKYDSHPHALVLRYFNPFPTKKISWGCCEICDKNMPLKHAYYDCRPCQHGAHLKCLSPLKKDLTSEELSKLIFRLPPSVEMFPSLIIREASLQEEKIDGEIPSRMTHKECHDHELTDHGDNSKKEKSTEVGMCSACVQPISSSTPYFSCKRKCNFLVHKLCTNLHSKMQGKILKGSMDLFIKNEGGFLETFFCLLCDRLCNGFGYRFMDEWYPGLVDVECASAPRIVEHASHENHILQLETSTDSQSAKDGRFHCCSRSSFSYRRRFYRCSSCTFRIHIPCALLPKQVTHKFDKHALQLITNGHTILSMQTSSSDHCKLEDHYFCEFCEEAIELKSWFYSCNECDHYFHVKCIPSVSKLSKFKVGGTYNYPESHSHPVTSVRMFTIGSQICEICGRTIRGNKDKLVFHCSTCNIWMHWYCM